MGVAAVHHFHRVRFAAEYSGASAPEPRLAFGSAGGAQRYVIAARLHPRRAAPMALIAGSETLAASAALSARRARGLASNGKVDAPPPRPRPHFFRREKAARRAYGDS